MRHPEPKRVAELNEKLKEQGDITEKEAGEINSLFSEHCVKTKLNFNSIKFEPGLQKSLLSLLETAAELVSHKHYGIFISSFSMASYVFDNFKFKDPVSSFLKLLPARDRIAAINISPSLREKLPQETMEILYNLDENPPIKLENKRFMYTTSRTGIFRLPELNRIFELCTDMSCLVPNSLSYEEDKFFYEKKKERADYNPKKDNSITVPCIISEAILHFIEKHNSPNMVFKTFLSSQCYDLSRILVDADTAKKIKNVIQTLQGNITAELRDSGLIYNLRKAETNPEIIKCNFSDFDTLMDYSRRLLEEALKYGMIIDQAKDKTLEEDSWILEGR